MGGIIRLLRRPRKTLLGIFLSLLACAIVCVCLGQYIASVQTQAYVEGNYTTAGVLTSKYMQEEILDDEGNVIGVTYFSEQPETVKNFISKLPSLDNTAFIKTVQQSALISAYLPDTDPLNFYGLGKKALSIDANNDATNQLEITPYTYAMLAIRVDEVGEIRPFINYQPSRPVDISAYGYAIDVTGIVLETVSLQQGYLDSVGKTARITVRFASEEDGNALCITPGQCYLLCGTDYQDLDAQLRLEFARFFGCDVSQIDWAKIEWMTEEEIAAATFDAVASYWHDDDEGLIISSKNAAQINSCSLTVCLDPLVDRGLLGKTEISLSSGTVLSADVYRTRFKSAEIARIETTAQDFLAQTDNPYWQEWLNTASINDHSFPIIAVDNLNAVSQFAIEDATVVAGRTFTQQETVVGAKVCVISESLAIANGLTVGDTISIRYYERDMDLRSNTTLPKQANPNPAYYSAAAGFVDAAEEYTIVGLYRQKNEWATGTYCFTPNTVFVPQSAAPGKTESICGGIYTSVILENGTAGQLEQLAAEYGLEGLFVCYDQGYSLIMSSLKEYYKVGNVVLRAGFALWTGIVLLFMFLFPYQLHPDLKRMWDLGTPPAKIRRHVFVSSAGILLPGTVLGCVAATVLFVQMTQYIASAAKADLTLELSVGTLILIAMLQMLVILIIVYSFVWMMTASLKKRSGRK